MSVLFINQLHQYNKEKNTIPQLAKANLGEEVNYVIIYGLYMYQERKC